ncbi:MAG: PaaI family thioesterase [Candidatus Omnitrophota bacterium]
MELQDDHYCFACGHLNKCGLKLQFTLDRENKAIAARFIPQKIHQGFKDIVHGGIIGLILDECMVNLVWKLGISAVTAEYTVRLLRPAVIGKGLIFSAKIVSEKTKMLLVDGVCRDEGGKKVAFSSAKCIKV